MKITKIMLKRLLEAPNYTPIHISTRPGMGSHALIDEVAQSIGVSVSHISLTDWELEDNTTSVDRLNITTPTLLVFSEFERCYISARPALEKIIFNNNNPNIKVIVVTYGNSDNQTVLDRCTNFKLTEPVPVVP